MWTGILVATAACYLLKLAGLSVPASLLDSPRVHRVAAFIPVVLLAALVAVQTFGVGERLTIDARAAGLAVAVVAVIRRAPFLVVITAAAATAAAVRALG